MPALGVSSRASARSRVDLPQAFAPTIAVIRPVGITTSRSSTTTRSSYGSVQVWFAEDIAKDIAEEGEQR